MRPLGFLLLSSSAMAITRACYQVPGRWRFGVYLAADYMPDPECVNGAPLEGPYCMKLLQIDISHSGCVAQICLREGGGVSIESKPGGSSIFAQTGSVPDYRSNPGPDYVPRTR